MSNILITGVSSGIGEALALLYLKEGYAVYGVSRRPPYKLIENPRFHYLQFDLSQLDEYDELLKCGLSILLEEGIDMLFLNAAVGGNVPNRCEEFDLNEIQNVISINVLANKLLLDLVLTCEYRPKICMVSASMAGIRYRAGTLPYSLSKAALAAMVGVYAEENPGVFFAVLGLCNVNTSLSRQVSFSERTSEFDELKSLQQRALSENYMVSPKQRAQDIHNILSDLKKFNIASGVFVDIRTIFPTERNY